MGRVNQLWQDAREARWQVHYEDFCMNECGGGQPEGRLHDEACEYANEMIDEEEQLTSCVGDPLLNRKRAA